MPSHIGRDLDQQQHPTQANHEVTLLRLAYRKAVRWGMVNFNPCVGVEPLKVKKRMKLITNEEFQKVYQAVPRYMQCMLDIAYIAVALVFFALAALTVRACERL